MKGKIVISSAYVAQKVSYGKQVALEETVKNLHEQVACLL